MAARIDGSDRTLQPGETLELAPGMPHTIWNPGPGPARAIWQTQPALDTEAFFAAMWGLAQTGQVNAKGHPPLRLGLRLLAAHQREFRLTRPAWPLQRLAFLLLGTPSGVELKGSSAEVRADSCYVGRPERQLSAENLPKGIRFRDGLTCPGSTPLSRVWPEKA